MYVNEAVNSSDCVVVNGGMRSELCIGKGMKGKGYIN